MIKVALKATLPAPSVVDGGTVDVVVIGLGAGTNQKTTES